MNKTPGIDILHQVKASIIAGDVLSPGDTVVVGVSGGPDSTALVHVLSCLRHELGLSVHAAHFNHGWRKSARTDERFVGRLARQLGVPCWHGARRGKLPRSRVSLEEEGRRQRFDFFRRLAEKLGARAVMLAHTQDDLAETVLMHILRGSGLQGMRGILSRRRVEGLEIIRPLLNIPKRAVLAYLKRNKIPFRIDPSNRRTEFLRNRIRLELLPLLEKKYSRNIRGLLAGLADTVGTDYDFLAKAAEKVFVELARGGANPKAVRFEKKGFLRQPVAVRRMLIRLAVEELRQNTNRLTLTHMRAVEAMARRGKIADVHLPGGLRVRQDAATVSVCLA
ncbi:MAG: tRNA lysidine(34) synthetase TilS [Candidatus Omnitrophica bacterium]|nr:tRNA lysidine(34) synthetase TilS [Candidatus Omnitrophota bacterium]